MKNTINIPFAFKCLFTKQSMYIYNVLVGIQKLQKVNSNESHPNHEREMTKIYFSMTKMLVAKYISNK